MARAQAVQAKYVDELMAKPYVVGVGIGLAKKADAVTQEVALIVMVSEKLPEAQLAPEDVLPTELDGVRVDVQEMGMFAAH